MVNKIAEGKSNQGKLSGSQTKTFVHEKPIALYAAC